MKNVERFACVRKIYTDSVRDFVRARLHRGKKFWQSAGIFCWTQASFLDLVSEFSVGPCSGPVRYDRAKKK